MTDRFASILDRNPTQVERPKPAPAGTYRCIIKGLPRYDKSSKKQTDFVEFQAVPQTAEQDVSEDDLKAYCTSSAGEVRPLSSMPPFKLTYYITEDAVWRLNKFLEDCGFDVTSEEYSLRQLCDGTANSEVYVSVKHEASQDGKSVFARAGDTAKVD